MSGKVQVKELSAAWDVAWQTRFCPPLELLADGPAGAELEEHRKACPACQQRAQWLEASPSPAPATPAASLGPRSLEDPRPGQLWLLDPGLAGWEPKQRYFNPPAVLVLRLGQHLGNSVLVAQTYHDPLLAAEGDQRLAPERWAQPWNTYTLHRDFLWSPCQDFGSAAAKSVFDASQEPQAETPDWSLVHLFRQMEIELGCFFASQAVCRLLEEHRRLAEEQGDGGQLIWQAGSSEVSPAMFEVLGAPGGGPQIYQELMRLGLGMPGGQAWTSATDLYFQVEPPREELARAAANSDQGSIVPVVALNLRRGLPAAWTLLEARVTDFVSGPQVLVGGKIAIKAAGEGAWQAQRISLVENRLRIRLFSQTGQ